MAAHAAVFPLYLRAAASVSTLTAATLMLSAHQTAHYTYSSHRVAFYDLLPYWSFVFANYTVAAYGALVIFLPPKSELWRFVVAIDVFMLAILSSSCSAAIAVGLLEKNGNKHALWDPIYDHVSSYCLRVLFASGFSYVGVLFYMFLHLRVINFIFDAVLAEV